MFYIVILQYRRCQSLTSFGAGWSSSSFTVNPKIIYGPSFDNLFNIFRYQNLVKKAVKEGVVVERNTLYDFFLQPTNECKTNISAAWLPYCDNDFWPGEAERLLEKKDDDTSQKKETQLGRLLRVAKRDDRKGNLEDILLVHKVGCLNHGSPFLQNFFSPGLLQYFRHLTP